MELFKGLFRKIAIGTLVVAAFGWFFVVVGFGIGTNEKGQPKEGSMTFPQWSVVIGGPVVLGCALAHAASPQPISSVLGGVTAFFGVFFAASLGMLLFVTGDFIRVLNAAGADQQPFVNLQFAGSFIAILFWTATMVLANFYDFAELTKQN